jgi:hypothetical protein
MESTHTNTLESQDSKMGLGLVRQRAAIAASIVRWWGKGAKREGTIVRVMDFVDVDNYNNLS